MMLKKIRQTHNFNFYILLWIVALAIILYLYQNWHIDKKFIGIVERKSHLIGAQESGKVHHMLIAIGDQVKKDQVMAILDISDLKTNLNQLKRELTSIQRLEGAQRDRFSILVQRMALQLENEASDLMDRLSLIESKSTELAGLNVEIERLKNAEQAGLGHSRDLSNLILQRDALASYLKEQSKDLEFQTQKLEKTRQSRKILEDADVDSITKSMLLEQMEYAESLRRQIAATEHRISLRTIVAPCDGYVTEMFARAGDVVEAFVPILTVEELKPMYLDVYIPEKSNLQPEPGMMVEIFSSRKKEYNTTGVITFVHPGFTRASERLSFRGQMFWARKARVELSKDHYLIPAEVVNTRIRKHIKSKDYLSLKAIASQNNKTDSSHHVKKHPPLMNMEVPETLWEITRFEPSGITWLPDIGKYLIVSDDTGIQDSQNDHAAYIFLMDDKGKVESTPVPLTGITTVNDLEAITPAGDESYYLISSQNISKKGKRPGSRELIIKIKQDDGRYIVLGQVQFLSLLLHSYSWDELKALGLEKFEEDGRPILNIEGATFHENALYLGLKEPISNKGAIIWKLDDVDNIFKNQKLTPNQLSVYGYVQLGQYKNKSASISDLTFDHNGKLWALSTIADVDEKDQLGGFHRINRFADERLEATCVFSFPGLKPEGICLQGTDRFIIVFDRDDENSAFCYVDAEKL
ncbi:MAG: efflux RND transporter periplasmic adaptor subunit [bacterium]|nr:MAG: efflux RND transporter periplasmic adaptor subunit [bacterium]